MGRNSLLMSSQKREPITHTGVIIVTGEDLRPGLDGRKATGKSEEKRGDSRSGLNWSAFGQNTRQGRWRKTQVQEETTEEDRVKSPEFPTKKPEMSGTSGILPRFSRTHALIPLDLNDGARRVFGQARISSCLYI